MANVVLVHGIAQEQRSADSLENEWGPALAGGVRAAGFADVADLLWRARSQADAIETRMAFYGNLFLKQDQQGGDAGELAPEEARVAEALGEEWLVRGATRSVDPRVSGEASRELALVRAEGGQELQGGALNTIVRLGFMRPGVGGLPVRAVGRGRGSACSRSIA